MHRGLCWTLLVVLSLGGCAKKAAPPEPASVETPPASPPAESNMPATATSPAKPEHPVVATMHEFLRAVIAGNYQRALSLTLPGEITEQIVKTMHDSSFQWDQVTFAQVWVGTEQAEVITKPIPVKDSPAAMAWAFNLVATEDGRWLIRLTDLLRTPAEQEDYVAAFREVAPGAKTIEP
jgi:hypothetical protein